MGVKILLVEDHTMVRLGLSLVFDNTDEIELIGEADNGKKGVELALELMPDVVLMDIGLPELDGIQATSIIKKANPNVKILIFTSRESEDDVFDALSAGADGYIMKGANEQQIRLFQGGNYRREFFQPKGAFSFFLLSQLRFQELLFRSKRLQMDWQQTFHKARP